MLILFRNRPGNWQKNTASAKKEVTAAFLLKTRKQQGLITRPSSIRSGLFVPDRKATAGHFRYQHLPRSISLPFQMLLGFAIDTGLYILNR